MNILDSFQCLQDLRPSTPKLSEKPSENHTISTASTAKPSAPIDPIEDLCSRVEALDLKAQKKAKSDEITRLSKLGLKPNMLP